MTNTFNTNSISDWGIVLQGMKDDLERLVKFSTKLGEDGYQWMSWVFTPDKGWRLNRVYPKGQNIEAIESVEPHRITLVTWGQVGVPPVNSELLRLEKEREDYAALANRISRGSIKS